MPYYPSFTVVLLYYPTAAFIGVLDIYGFENFHTNGFEQLLINYANEKLQSHFNKHIFQIEQAEYEAEGIDWSYVTFYDNQPCVELIDGRPANKSGIFQTLDDASGTNRMDVNSSFLAQINMSWSECKGSLTTRHPNYLAPRFNSDCIFGVQHYAGEVFYNIAHFAEKNRDSTSNDLRELLLRSHNGLLKDAVENCSGESVASPKAPPPAAQASGKSGAPTGIPVNAATAKRNAVVSKLKEDSISKQFCASLKLLSDTLDSTDPHFVRCMKPNSRKCPNLLHAVDLRAQLRNAGMMETIRIRKQGYASRHPHKEFFQRYLPLAPGCSTLGQVITPVWSAPFANTACPHVPMCSCVPIPPAPAGGRIVQGSGGERRGVAGRHHQDLHQEPHECQARSPPSAALLRQREAHPKGMACTAAVLCCTRDPGRCAASGRVPALRPRGTDGHPLAGGAAATPRDENPAHRPPCRRPHSGRRPRQGGASRRAAAA